MQNVYILDTTLRDGTQAEGVSLTVADKIRIARKLDEFGIAYIEGGFPGANPKDQEFFQQARRELRLNHAKLVAFGSTRRPNASAASDEGVRALLDSGTPAVAIVGKAWDFHVRDALNVTLEENLRMIADTVAWLKQHGKEVIFDAEHFFDGYLRHPDYALATLRAAAEHGVDWIALCDTNGGTLPHQIAEIVRHVCDSVPVPIGIHAHNDCELAVANSLSAVQAGARMVHGTINGIGERCGNANLASVIPNLELKLGVPCLADRDRIALLTETSRYVAEVANLVPHGYQPFVGHSAFAHKGGIHVSAILRDPETYEHIPPESVGNTRRVLVSELSGLSNLQYRAQELGIDLTDRKEEVRSLLQVIKEMEYQGYQFEGAEATQELLLIRAFDQYHPPFSLVSMRVLSSKEAVDDMSSEAMVKLTVNGRTVHTAAEGKGPVHALDHALRKALQPFYPELERVHLTDYKVRVLSGMDGTAAKVRVLIESSNGYDVWRTVGVSHNVIEASWEALADSIGYFLVRRAPVSAHSPSSSGSA
ncbi:citramalate synthase [Alicyclobacillus contaminans]|uniref:citramalate synthase n=1 Tax=Alicyclobacillus contaminans TaxID=392016 RepID=UPI0003FB9638|nr:citramalate synthase [Alicyclobacillus contaminans]GMA48785.1 citramalate synthase [Alicyclobacillus contaminans]